MDLNSILNDFYDFVEINIENFNKYIEKCKNVNLSNKEALSYFSRIDRRQIQKEEINKQEIHKVLSCLNSLVDFEKEIIKILDIDNQALNNDSEFNKLLYILTLYRVLKGKSIDITRLVLAYFISSSKEVGITSNFLNCFDENGNLIIEKSIILNRILIDFYNKIPYYLKSVNCDFITLSSYINTLITENDIMTATEILDIKRKKKLEEQEKLRLEKQLENQRKKEEKLKSKNNNTTYIIPKRNKNNDPQYKLLEKYINPTTFKIKQNVKCSIEEFTNEINKNELLDKNLINILINDYKKILCDRRINRITTRILKNKNELTKFKSFILDNYFDNEECIHLKEFLSNDEIDKISDKDLKEIVLKFIEENTIISNNEMQNYIVFSEETLLENEKQIIYNSKTHENKDTAIKSVYNHLLTLKNTNIYDIQANKDNAFHILMIGNSQQYIIDDKLKCYRYGSKKTKIAFIKLGILKENQIKLQEIYNTNINSNVLLVFGIGNVLTENEQELYERIRKYSIINKDKLVEIYNIFSNPFNEETLKIACDLINNGIKEIDKLNIKNKELVLRNEV